MHSAYEFFILKSQTIWEENNMQFFISLNCTFSESEAHFHRNTYNLRNHYSVSNYFSSILYFINQFHIRNKAISNGMTENDSLNHVNDFYWKAYDSRSIKKTNQIKKQFELQALISSDVKTVQ